MMIGELLRTWRTKSHIGLGGLKLCRPMGVREAAKKIGLSSATYSRIENGGAVDGKTMAKLIAFLFGPQP